MKRCVLYLFTSCSLSSLSQVFWTEGFTVGTTCAGGTSAAGYASANGTWTVTNTGTNNSSANAWFVSGKEKGMAAGVCGTGCATPQNKTLHLGSTGLFLDLGAAYNATGAGNITDKRAESPTINCSGKSTITLAFNYIEFGQGTSDNATLWYFDGATWSQLVDIPKSLCCGSALCNGSLQGLWTAYSIALPASANNNAAVKIGFRWVNNGDGVGTDPSFAVDNITLSVPVVLPIELKDFSYTSDEQNRISLNWETLSERNTDYFGVERSIDGYAFYNIANVKAANNSKNLQRYSIYDSQPGEGTIYYRLKIVDNDETYNYSQIVTAEATKKIASANEFVSPDFFEVNTEWIRENQFTKVSIYNSEGKEVLNSQLSEVAAQSTRTKLSLNGLSSGIYFCHFTNETSEKSFKFLISQ